VYTARDRAHQAVRFAMALNVLASNMKRLMAIAGVCGLLEAMRA
jgi:hypothetical protein